jgi:hypothetical protein
MMFRALLLFVFIAACNQDDMVVPDASGPDTGTDGFRDTSGSENTDVPDVAVDAGCDECDEPPQAPSIGGACSDSADCNGACYSDVPGAEPGGWVDGYCMSPGCETDSDCDEGAVCAPARNGTNVCLDVCRNDAECRLGYTCHFEADVPICRPGCEDDAGCPTSYSCSGGICVADDIRCSAVQPAGWCPDGSFCIDGHCSSDPFECGGNNDPLEPNDSLAAAVDAPDGVTTGLSVCAGDEDWFRVVVPAGKLVTVRITFEHDLGDLDLVAYDGAGELIGARSPGEYPYIERQLETDEEVLAVIGSDTVYKFRVVGHLGAINAYTLHVDEVDFADAARCTEAFTQQECVGAAPAGTGLIAFPFPDASSMAGFDNYEWATVSNYRFARRELVMLVRWAINATSSAFENTHPIGLVDASQRDGITSGFDVGFPRHPARSHDQGGSIDIAYFQTDGENAPEIVCGDGSTHYDRFCSETAVNTHKVDLERQAFFMGKLFGSTRLRVIGVDRVLAPLIRDAAVALGELPQDDPQHLTADEVAAFDTKMGSGDDWPFHHHHIHVSLQWWTGSEIPPPL